MSFTGKKKRRLNTVGRLNGVVSLVTVFEELSLVTSPSCSRNKANSGIPLFYEQDFKSSRRSRPLLISDAYDTSPFTRPEKWFRPFCSRNFSSCFSNALRLFHSLGQELDSLLVCRRIKCYIVIIHLSVCLPTEYSVLVYSLLYNLMHY